MSSVEQLRALRASLQRLTFKKLLLISITNAIFCFVLLCDSAAYGPGRNCLSAQSKSPTPKKTIKLRKRKLVESDLQNTVKKQQRELKVFSR